MRKDRGTTEIVWGVIGGGLIWWMGAPPWGTALAFCAGAAIGGLHSRLDRLEAELQRNFERLEETVEHRPDR